MPEDWEHKIGNFFKKRKEALENKGAAEDEIRFRKMKFKTNAPTVKDSILKPILEEIGEKLKQHQYDYELTHSSINPKQTEYRSHLIGLKLYSADRKREILRLDFYLNTANGNIFHQFQGEERERISISIFEETTEADIVSDLSEQITMRIN